MKPKKDQVKKSQVILEVHDNVDEFFNRLPDIISSWINKDKLGDMEK